LEQASIQKFAAGSLFSSLTQNTADMQELSRHRSKARQRQQVCPD